MADDDELVPPGDVPGPRDVPGPTGDGRPVFTWSTALLPALALAGLLAGSTASSTSTADDRPAGRTVVELQVTDR